MSVHAFCLRSLEIWKKTEEAGKFVSSLKKYQKALCAARVKKFDKDDPIYENAVLAIRIRNGLTHYKSYMYNSARTHPIDELIDLIETPITNPLRHPSPVDNEEVVPGPSRILCSDGVTWVLNSCDKFVDEWHCRIGLENIWWRIDDPEY